MAILKSFIPILKRRRQGKVDYAARRRVLMGRRPFAVIRISNKYIQIQISSAMPGGDKVIAQAHSAELSKLGWKLGKKNLPAAYLTGLLAAKRLPEDANQNEIVPYCDVRPFVHGSRVAAAIKGLKDGGAPILSDDAVSPSEERLRGAHMSYTEDSSRKRGERGSLGPKEVHHKGDPMEYEEQFEAVKSKILNLDHKEEKRKRKG